MFLVFEFRKLRAKPIAFITQREGNGDFCRLSNKNLLLNDSLIKLMEYFILFYFHSIKFDIKWTMSWMILGILIPYFMVDSWFE